MTSPQLPSQPISSPYALLANGANGATSGLAEFASWTKDDWDAFLSGKWVPHFDGIGGPLAAAWEWINAITSAFQGDFGPLEDLLGEVIEGFVAGFTDLKAAFEGTYTGTDSVLLGIQSFVSGKWLGLGNAQTMLQQIADILNGLIVTPINSAVQGVKDWFAGLLGWQSSTTADVATATSNAASASSAAANAQTASNQIAQNINNAISGGVAAGSGAIAQAFDSVASIFGLASAANTAAISAQTQLAAQQNGSDSNTSGFSWSTQFSGSDGALSSSDWTTNGIQIVDGTGYAGIPSGSANGYYYALANYLLTTDTDSAVMTLGTLNGGNSSSFGGADYYTGLGIRCNADFTTGAFCRVNKSGISIGKFNRSGTSLTFTVLSSASMTVNAGDVVRFKASGSNYYALVNGSTKLSVTDSGGTIPVGASYRSAGFFEQRASNVFFTDNSFRVASFGMSDWKDGSAAVTTPSWRLRRGTTSAVTLSVATGEQAAMPANFYTVQDLASAVTVTTLGTGQITILQDGWYEISASQTSNDTTDKNSSATGTQSYWANAWRACHWVLFVDSVAIVGPISSGSSVTVFLAAGQVVYPGVVAAYPLSDGVSGAGANGYITSTISNISGGPSASFMGRKVA